MLTLIILITTKVLMMYLAPFKLSVKALIKGLNAWGERTIQVDCSFLPQDKKYTIEIFQDKKRSNKNANLYEHKIMDMDNKNIIEMFMASGGGFVIVIREKK
jgi:alpha-glucosidase